MHAIPNQAALAQLLDDVVEAHRLAIREIRDVLQQAAALNPAATPKLAASHPLSIRLRGALALLKYRPPRQCFPAAPKPARQQPAPDPASDTAPARPPAETSPARAPLPQSATSRASAQAFDDSERNPPAPADPPAPEPASTPKRAQKPRPPRPHPFAGMPAWGNFHLHPDYNKPLAEILAGNPHPPWPEPDKPADASGKPVCA